MDRYHRQILLPQIGPAGQKRLADSSVLLVGCGALGSNIAEQLARAGVGHLRIADRDIVELTNLQRQVLFDESNAKEGLPKAVAAARRLTNVNSTIRIEPKVVDVDADNIELLLRTTGFQPVPGERDHGLKARGTGDAEPQVNLILDGTDNVATRYLLNDVAIKFNIPWIYGACVGTEGRVMTICPNKTACLRCIFPQPPDPNEIATCDTAGVLGPVAAIVGAMQSIAAIKLLSGNADAIANELLTFDLWANRIRSVSTVDARRANCPACGQRKFEFLQTAGRDMTSRLCGRNAVQVRPTLGRLSLKDAAARLQSAGTVQASPFMVRCTLNEGDLQLSAFEDGRVIVQGTNDPGRARAVVAKYLGS
jgi:adenylyltransferase/sulfurtransferase